MDLARKRGTAHPLLSAYLIAQRINRASGGSVIAPWEVDNLPDEWLDAAEMLVDDVRQMAQGYRQVDNVLEKWRAEHRKKYG